MSDGGHGGGHVGGGHVGGGHHGAGHGSGAADNSAAVFAHGRGRRRHALPLSVRLLLSLLFGVAVAVGSVWLGQLLHH